MSLLSDPFALIYKSARELEAAEKSKDPKRLKDFDFSIGAQVCLFFLFSSVSDVVSDCKVYSMHKALREYDHRKMDSA